MSDNPLLCDVTATITYIISIKQFKTTYPSIKWCNNIDDVGFPI